MNFMRLLLITRSFRSAPGMRALRIGTRAVLGFTKICARTTTRWSTPRNIWPSSSTGRAPRSSAEKSSSLRTDRFPFQRDATLSSQSSTPPPRPAPTMTRRPSHSSRYDTHRQDLAFHFGLGYRADRRRASGDLVACCVPDPRRTGAISAVSLRGSLGAFIEDKNSGTILLQQAWRRQMPARGD